MKKFVSGCLVFALFFVGCKEDKKVSLAKNCEVEYKVSDDGESLCAIKITNGDKLFQMCWNKDGESFRIDENENLSLAVNTMPDGLCSYEIIDSNQDFKSVLNLYESGDTSFEIATPVYQETVNAFPSSENSYAESWIRFDDGQEYLLRLNRDGTYEVNPKISVQ